MIPKTIHYCWFGGNQKPEIIEKCIASWREHCPDYQIIEWNESNYDVTSLAFVNDAYNAKMWAFVSDVVRIEVIYKYGGIYLDTDVELKTSMDHYLSNHAFFFWETSRNVATGLGYGAEKGHDGLKSILEMYSRMQFDKSNLTPCPAINTEGLIECYPELIRNGQTQLIRGSLFVSNGEYTVLATHHSTGLWSAESKVSDKTFHYRSGKLKNWFRGHQRFDWVEEHFGNKAVKLYTFLVYDLIDYGFLYYVRRRHK